MHNLTVGKTHTYYVVAGATPVLVHNAAFCIKLALHEKVGGHTLAKHVGKTDAELIARAVDEKLPRVSTFTDIEVATILTEENIKANADQVARFLTRGKTKTSLIYEGPMSHFVGKVYDSASGKFLQPNAIETWLVRDPNMPEGYYIETSFPIVK
jgi:hypothetical protein